MQTWLSKRPAAWLLVAIVLIVGVVLPVSVIVMHRAEREVPAWVPGDDFWNSGPLSPAHQQAAGVRCDTCHQQPFVRVQDERARAATRRFTITSRPSTWR